MDALGNFLKIALYRVIAVLIVGIPAVELFSHIFLGNGIVIKQVDNETIPAKVKWQLDNFQVSVGSKIPGTIEISNEDFSKQKGKLILEIPKANINFQYDPQIKIQHSNTSQIGNTKFKFNNLPTAGWVFYLTIAWILGEILCFLGETLIGFSLFDFKPFDLRIVEKTTPSIGKCVNCNNYRNLQNVDNLLHQLGETIKGEINNKNFRGNESLRSNTVKDILNSLNSNENLKRILNKLKLDIELIHEKLKNYLDKELKDKCFNHQNCENPTDMNKFIKKFEEVFFEQILCLPKYITTQDFLKASNNTTIMEISEVHFVLSRIFSGLFALIWILDCALVGVIIGEKIWVKIGAIIGIITEIIALIILAVIERKIKPVSAAVIGVGAIIGTITFVIPLLIAIIYRAHANKLLKAAAQEGSESEHNPRTR